MNKRNLERRDPFAENSSNLEEVANEIYGAPDDDAGLRVGRVVARAISIKEIWADPTQPRRAVPMAVREEWDGDPADVASMLMRWSAAVETLIGQPIHEKAILSGEQVLFDEKAPTHGTIAKYRDLLQLAASIHDTQLNQPIGVVAIKDGYKIVFGERRWLAYHLLDLNFPSESAYAKIPARILEADDFDLAKSQASENMARSDLNAIEKARQFAKLLMMAAEGGDIDYNRYSDLVLPGGCDRRYFAQVANGNIHRIPRGMGPVFEQSLNISTQQMRQYRNLLKLTDDDEVNDTIWMLGDDANWAEGFMREIASLPLSVLQNTLYTVTTVTVYEVETVLRNAIAEQNRLGEEQKRISQISQDREAGIPKYDPPVRQAPSPAVPDAPSARHQWQIGNRVITRSGREGVVVGFSGRYVNVKDTNGVKAHEPETLSPPPFSHRDEEKVSASSSIASEPYQPARSGASDGPPIGTRVSSPYGFGDIIRYNDDGSVKVKLLENNKMVRGDTVDVLPVNLQVQLELPIEADEPDESQWQIGDRVLTPNGYQGTVESVTGNRVYVHVDYVVNRFVDKTFEYVAEDLRPDLSPIADAAQDDDRDKELSQDGLLLDQLPPLMRKTLEKIGEMANVFEDFDTAASLGQLIEMNDVDVDWLAANTVQESHAWLSSHDTKIANLLERVMQQVESYTAWIREQVQDMRGDGA